MRSLPVINSQPIHSNPEPPRIRIAQYGHALPSVLLALMALLAAPARAATPMLQGLLTPPTPEFRALHPEPKVLARSALLADAGTHTVLWARNPYERLPMASLTKVMTALLLIENARPDEVVTTPLEATLSETSSLNLRCGEQISVHDLLYAILLRSANDACVAAAYHVSGSVPAFAALMNRRARQLGCTDTSFVNPNGLPAQGHYSTAADLARITLEAIRYPVFNRIVATRKYVVTRSMNQEDRVVTSHCKLLGRYQGADGVKTGYTRAAGHCFIGTATRYGRRLMVVILNSPDMWGDAKRLLDYGFAAFDRQLLVAPGQYAGAVPVTGGLARAVRVMAGRQIMASVPRGVRLPVRLSPTAPDAAAPLRRGQRIGVVRVYAGNALVGTVPAIAAADLPALPGAGWHHPWIAAFLLLLAIARYRAEVAAKRRRARLRRLRNGD